MRPRSTYFVSTAVAGRRHLFQKTAFAELFIKTLREHHAICRLEVYAFVVMPDHIHLLFTPGFQITLERSMNLVKGAFSYRIKKELGYAFEVWSEGYCDTRIRSAAHCAAILKYIEMNPVRRGLVNRPKEYPFSSASGRWRMNPLPQWLKPLDVVVSCSAT
jgi:putative transposase